MFQNERERNRNDWIRDEYDIAEAAYRARVASAHNIQDILDDMHRDIDGIDKLLDKATWNDRWTSKKHCIRLDKTPCSAFPRLDIITYNMSLPKAIDKLAGVIHRRYNVDWKMDVDASGDIDLTTKVGKVKVTITVNKGIPSCKVVSTGKQYHSYSTEQFKIVCS